MGHQNMSFEDWYKWVFKTPSAYGHNSNNTNKDQCLLLHSAKNDLFVMYVISEKEGVKKEVKCKSTRGIYDFLLNNYCNKPNTDKGKQQTINVYYSDQAVFRAMVKGIKAGDVWLKFPRQTKNLSNRVVSETTMFRCINLRWTSYYFGYTVDDKTDLLNMFKDIQNRFKVCPADQFYYGFTSHLKDRFGVKTYLLGDFCLDDGNEGTELQKMIVKYCNLGALMGSINKNEMHNIFSYDIDSAYIYHIFNDLFPSNKFKRLSVDEYEIKEGYTHFMLARVTLSAKIKYAKKSWYPQPAGADSEYDESIGNLRTTATNKIMECKDYILGLWDEDLELLKEFYDVLLFQPICIYEFELMPLPDELKLIILDLYKNKTKKKASGQNYHTEKIILNRGGYGLWVTKKYLDLPKSALEEKKTIRVQSDSKVPFQIGSYVVAMQRKLLLNTMQEIGMDHVVAFHTDSIKTDINCDNYFKDYNSNINIYGKMGHFEKEWKADRIYFFNTVRYKADTDKGLIIKHGGIDENDIKDIFNMEYDDITEETKIEITLPHTTWIDVDNATKHCKRTITQIGRMEEWMKTTESGELLAI